MNKPGLIYFAGGGTGGHLYPSLAVAEEIKKISPQTQICFFCSGREIDAKILGPSGFDFMPLPAMGFSASPGRCIRFFAQLIKSYYFVRQIMQPDRRSAKVLGTGGFVSAPVVFAARSLGIPVYMLNVDSVPGRANRLIGRFADKVFVQYESTRKHFAKVMDRVEVTGCPLRDSFLHPDRSFLDTLGAEREKKTLVVTGASSGSMSINKAILAILPKLDRFADRWQIVHLTGAGNYWQVRNNAPEAAIKYLPVEYCHNMADLLSAADLAAGRSGAVSVAEYAAAGVPSVCLPYPHHKDMHQALNAQELVNAGAAVIVEDHTDLPETTHDELLRVLSELMEDDPRRLNMANAARKAASFDAAARIAHHLLNT